MDEFVRALRGDVESAHEKLIAAREAGHNYEVHLHVARIKDLLELAERHNVDTASWIDPSELTSAIDGD